MMRRFLCFSLCLGLMVSACKKKSLEESVNKAIAKAGAGGAGSGSGGDGGGGGTTVKKKDKAAVLKACLPLINTKLIKKWGEGDVASFFLFLRRSTTWKTTKAVPLVVLYTGFNLPLELTEAHGLGKDKATVTENLNKMAVSKVIQDQFVARDGNASGWRVHISRANTNVEIPMSEPGQPPVVPESHKGKIIIYDRENTKDAKDGRTPAMLAKRDLNQANRGNFRGGWFDCVVDDKTQAVTFKYTEAPLTVV